MAMKAEEFLALRQGDKSVMEYVSKFNHLSQYAPEHVDTNRKKKACFMHGLNTKLQTMMTTYQSATYYEAINIAITSEEKNKKHKEAKKATSSSFSGRSQKRQRIIYHPQSHGRFLAQPPFCGPFPSPQYRPGQQVYPRPTAIATAPPSRMPRAFVLPLHRPTIIPVIIVANLDISPRSAHTLNSITLISKGRLSANLNRASLRMWLKKFKMNKGANPQKKLDKFFTQR